MAFVEYLLDRFHPDGCMPKSCSYLDGLAVFVNPDVGTVVEEMCGKRVPEQLRRDVKPNPKPNTIHYVAYRRVGHRFEFYRGVFR